MLWIPGPTEVRPAILAECARAQIGHRGKEMERVLDRIDPLLRTAFGLAPGSPAQVAVHTTSGTGLMEAALHGVGARVLHLVNGAFSRRWFEIAKLLGKEALLLEAPLGSAVPPEMLSRALAERGPFDAVCLTVNETATGVRTPIAPIAAALSDHPRTRFLVDVVSYLGGGPVDCDAQRIDFAFASSQKALGLPPGIAVCAASSAYLEEARARKRASFYLDPVRVIDGHAQRKTPATPCIPLYFALQKQLEDIDAGVVLPPAERAARGTRGARGTDAWRARFRVHERMQLRTSEWARAHGLELLPAAPLASPTVSCIRAGALDVEKLTTGLEARGHTISNGYGDLKGKSFRIGHMGDHTEAELEELLAAADEVLPLARSA